MEINVNILHDYLKDVLDIESNLYVLQKLSEELHYKLSRMPLLEYPDKPVAPKTITKEKSTFSIPIKIIIVIIGMVVVSWLCCLEKSKEPPFSILVTLWIFHLISIFVGIVALAFLVLKNSENKRVMQELKKAEKSYKQKLSIWQDEIIKTKLVNSRRQTEQDIIKANIDAVEKQFSSSLLALDKLYSANIIHPKYRNLSAVSSLYEYIDTGRCLQLEGPNGAYNVFESEVRLDHILLKMDEVIKQLDSIRQSQYQLYAAVTEGNQRTDSLLASVAQDIESISASEMKTAKQLSDISVNEKIIAYNTERTKLEMEYYNRMRYRLGDYNKVWNNKRP